LALHDGLTNLYNHRHFVATLDTEIEKARKIDAPVSLIMADIDNFKRYNDTHGHPRGDVLLRQVAKILLENTRQRDIVARYGGEEFVIILPVTGRYGARRVAETIRAQIEQHPFHGEDQSGPITVTLGVAVFPQDAATAEELIQQADDALYRGKDEGKNRVCWSSPPTADSPQPATT
ncbi:MAG: GGDEF domain-containing protein, partial [Planctomycetota bacterium]